ncbi:hypothetical protein ACFL6S_36560, partial [Candidatus Poribacteria bacterium]
CLWHNRNTENGGVKMQRYGWAEKSLAGGTMLPYSPISFHMYIKWKANRRQEKDAGNGRDQIHQTS